MSLWAFTIPMSAEDHEEKDTTTGKTGQRAVDILDISPGQVKPRD